MGCSRLRRPARAPPHAMETTDEHHIGLEKIRAKKKVKRYKCLIDSIGLFPQSVVTFYIYRVGKTYPAKNPICRSKSIKFPNCTRTPHGPVGPTGHTGRLLPDRIQRADQSDRLGAPVRPVMPILAINTRPIAFVDSSYKFHY